MATPTPFGGEFRVNTTTNGNQAHASVAALAGGKFVVVWDDLSSGFSADVKGQIYNADGTKFGVEITIAGDGPGFSWDQQRPVVAGTADGRFTVAWEDRFVPGQPDIYGRVFNPDWSFPDGAYATGFPVDTGDNPASAPSIAAAQGGRFMIGWTYQYSAFDNDVYARAFNAAGAFSASEIAVDENAPASESETAIAGLANGNYVVAWTDTGQAGHTDGSGTHIRMSIYTGPGDLVSALGGLRANYQTTGDQFDPSVAGLSNGDYVIVYTENTGGFGSSDDVVVRLFYASGSPVSNFPPNYPNNNSGDANQATVVATATGYVIAWVDSGDGLGGGTDGSGAHIRAQFYTNEGVEAGEEFIANTTVKTGSQSDPHVAVLADGRVVITWTDPGLAAAQDDTSGTSIRAQIYDPRTAAVEIFGTALDNDFVGTPFGDTLSGVAGDDTLNGAAGDDTLGGGDDADILRGGAGLDQLFGNIGDDTLDGGTEADTLTGGDGDDTYLNPNGDTIVEAAGAAGGLHDLVKSIASVTLAANVEDLILSGAGNSNGIGNALANSLTGNSGANILNGGGGADTLNGGAGADTLNGGGGDDTYINPAGDTIGEAAGAAGGLHDIVKSGASFSLGPIANLEDLTLTGNAAINGIGNNLANILTGNTGANVLNGGGGTDTLIGGRGADIMNGGGGADLFKFDTVNTGADTIGGFETALDRFDLGGGTFSARTESGGNTLLTHQGGTILVTGVTGLTLVQWKALTAGGGRENAPAAVSVHDGAVHHDAAAFHASAHGDFLFA